MTTNFGETNSKSDVRCPLIPDASAIPLSWMGMMDDEWCGTYWICTQNNSELKSEYLFRHFCHQKLICCIISNLNGITQAFIEKDKNIFHHLFFVFISENTKILEPNIFISHQQKNHSKCIYNGIITSAIIDHLTATTNIIIWPMVRYCNRWKKEIRWKPIIKLSIRKKIIGISVAVIDNTFTAFDDRNARVKCISSVYLDSGKLIYKIVTKARTAH